MEQKNKNDIVVGVEVTLKNPDAFLILKETLSRMGMPSKHSNTLYQSAHILHRKGRYFIVSFKELFMLDKRETDISEDDYRRRNSIAKLVANWGLCSLVNKKDVEFLADPGSIKVIANKDKKDWTLVKKYTIGRKSGKTKG